MDMVERQHSIGWEGEKEKESSGTVIKGIFIERHVAEKGNYKGGGNGLGVTSVKAISSTLT